MIDSMSHFKNFFRAGERGDHSAAGVAQYEASSRDRALAICADALRPGTSRVEVRIGRDLATKTNPGDFRLAADHQARAFVRDGRPMYQLSVDWADLLQGQDRIFVRVIQHESVPGAKSETRRVLSRREEVAIKEEIKREFLFSLQRLPASSVRRLAGMTLTCRDPEVDKSLRRWKNSDEAAWHEAFRRLAETSGAAPDSSFAAEYVFQPQAPRSEEVGAGRLIVTLHQDATPRGATVDPVVATPPMAPGATYDIGEEDVAHTIAWVQLAGLGTERIEGAIAVAVPLPGVINRDTLRRTPLPAAFETSLRLVSNSAPIGLALDRGCLQLIGRVKRGADGIEKPSAFLFVDGVETALVGRRRVPAGEAELLFGGESHRVGRAPDGSPLRPVRVRVSLKSVDPRP
jgi:hypothetical protein